MCTTECFAMGWACTASALVTTELTVWPTSSGSWQQGLVWEMRSTNACLHICCLCCVVLCSGKVDMMFTAKGFGKEDGEC